VSYLTYDDANRYEDVHNSPDDLGVERASAARFRKPAGQIPFVLWPKSRRNRREVLCEMNYSLAKIEIVKHSSAP